MLAIGDLDVMLRELEAVIQQFVPQCSFYLGEGEEKMRAKSPPFVAWQISGGDPSEETREIAATDHENYRDDFVTIVARCAGLVPAGQQGPDVRRQQLAATMQVFLAVSWACAKLHQGYGGAEDQGWETINPDGISDAYYPLDYTFRIRAGRAIPPLVQVQPTSQEPTITLEQP